MTKSYWWAGILVILLTIYCIGFLVGVTHVGGEVTAGDAKIISGLEEKFTRAEICDRLAIVIVQNRFDGDHYYDLRLVTGAISIIVNLMGKRKCAQSLLKMSKGNQIYTCIQKFKTFDKNNVDMKLSCIMSRNRFH